MLRFIPKYSNAKSTLMPGRCNGISMQPLLKAKCPNANPITARMCAEFCNRMLQSFNDDEPELVRTVRSACLNGVGGFPSVVDLAAQINVSPRTLHRRLAESGISYQAILDDVRRRLAEEYLRNTALSIEEVAARTGFSEASNFRKAFKKWHPGVTGRLPPSHVSLGELVGACLSSRLYEIGR